MASEAKIKLSLDGEKEFKSALTSITAQSKALNAEMKAVTSSFDKNTTAEEKNRKTSELLSKRQDAYQKKLDVLKDRIEERTAAFGENSDYVNKLKKQYFDTETEMNKMTKSVEQMAEASDDASDSALGFSDVLVGNLLGNVIASGLEALASKFVEMSKAVIEFGMDLVVLADDLNTLAKTTGLSTQTLQEFEFASSLIDVDTSTLTGSLTKLTRTMYSASTGSKASAEAFSSLGINIKNADGSLRPAYDVFLDTIDALGKIEDATTRDGLAMSIFGKSRQELNPLIMAGSSALEEYAEQARAMGYVMDQETLDAMNEVNDQVDLMKLQFEALKNQLGMAVVPVISEVIEALKDFVATVDWETVGQVIYVALMTIVGAFEARYYTVKTVIDIFTWLGGVMEDLPNKFSELSENVRTKMEDIKNAVKGKFEELINNAKNWGRDMIQGFIDGIKEKIGRLANAASGLANTVASYLHFSHPDKGRLANYETWMPDMVEGLARTLTASSYKMENAVAGLAGGVAGGMRISLGGITINGVADESQIDRMVNQIEQKLGRRLYR